MTTVEKIHQSFNTSSDRLLNEANEIINNQSHLIDKMERLKRVGFVKSREVEAGRGVKMAAELASLIKDYQQRYPLNKFITPEQVELINSKYNLICAPISCYTGFVPASKLELIERFRIASANDYRTNKMKVGEFSYPSSQSVLIKRFLEEHPDGIINVQRTHSGGFIFNGEIIFCNGYDLIDEQSLCICAPAKDLNLKLATKIGNLFKISTYIPIPDPVVLQPVKGGYLILAAWGDEASDPIVVNEINN